MKSLHARFPEPELKVNGERDAEGLAWLSEVALLRDGHMREDMERLLELFAMGTEQGKSVLQPSQLSSERDAWHMAALDVTHEYFGNFNLEQPLHVLTHVAVAQQRHF